MCERTFNKGDSVEVIKDNYYYPATVLRPPSKTKNLVFLQYLTLYAASKPLRQYVNVANVRPTLPLLFKPSFKVGDAVDAFRHSLHAWCPATVSRLLDNSYYLLSFPDASSASFHHSSLRLHRDSLLPPRSPPPLPSSQEQAPEMLKKPESLRFRIKYSRRPIKNSRFKEGMMVEVSNDDEGYEGVWFVATIVERIGKDRFLVEYRDLTTDDGMQLLKEEIGVRFIRPCPPEVPVVDYFKQLQEVDAWFNDGWWEGVVVQVLDHRECSVAFISNDVLKFENSKLRPHQDWLDGKWVMPSKKPSELVKKFGNLMPKAKNLIGNKLILKCPKPSECSDKPSECSEKPRDVKARTRYTRIKFVVHLCKGAKVEVRSDEEGYQGAWYAATIVDSLQNGKYLVEYLTLKTDDLTQQLKEVADASDIRPYPPDVHHDHHFALRERVDAWYNEGWWVGQVCGVLSGFKYKVYFWPTKEELEFEHSHLRPHQEWIDGRWVLASLE